MIISLEPMTLFDSLPANLRADAPQAVWDDEGVPAWVVNGVKSSFMLTDGAVGVPVNEWDYASRKYEDFRTGVYDVDARVKDMDINGVWASLNFPSTVWGFCGKQFARMNPATGLACVRAYNDWVYEWCGQYPERFIACQLPWLGDPIQAAAEIRANAARGFHAVSFSENPVGLGLNSPQQPAYGIRSSPRAKRPTRYSISMSVRRARCRGRTLSLRSKPR